MSQNPVNREGQSEPKPSNFYFRILFKSISHSEGQESLPEIKLTISKGMQLFELTKQIPLEWNQNSQSSINNQRLNFVVLNYDNQKYEQFILRIKGGKSEEDVGEYSIDCNNYIDHFEKTKNGNFEQRLKLGDIFTVDVLIFVEKKRLQIQRMSKEAQHPKQGENSMKTEFQRLEERSHEVKEKYVKVPREGRFKRAKSPTRREIKEIISRRQSPGRQSPTSRKELSSIEKTKKQEPIQKIQTEVRQSQLPRQEEKVIEYQNKKMLVEKQQEKKEQTPCENELQFQQTQSRLVKDQEQKIQKPEVVNQIPTQKVQFLQKSRSILSNPKVLAVIIAVLIIIIINGFVISDDQPEQPQLENVKPSKVKAIKPVKSTKPTKPIKQAKQNTPNQPPKPTKTTPPTKTSQTSKTTEPTKPKKSKK